MIIDNLIKSISTLPGLGKRSASRIVLYLLGRNRKLLKYIGDQITEALEKVTPCKICGNISESQPCNVCLDKTRDERKLCIINSVEDLWNIESSSIFRGLYHVIGFSESDFNSESDEPSNADVELLISRIREGNFEEIILANSTTVSGQTLSFYIANVVKQINENISITTLGRGIPIGSEIDYLDHSTINAAFGSRKKFEE